MKTPKEVIPWEGGAHVSGNLLFHPILKHFISLYWNIYSSESILAFIGCKTEDRFEYLSSTNTSGKLSQSSGEPLLAFIGCKAGGKPNR